MPHWRVSAGLLAGAAALALALPAIGQETPESLLPPGFGDPAPAPPAQENAPAAPTPSAAPPATPVPLPAPPPPAAARAGEETVVTEATPEELAALAELLPEPVEIPDASRRPVEIVGPLTDHGLGAGAFGSADGAFKWSLMQRLDAPLPSRWASILLRRALLSRAASPAGINPVDWIAARAWLLIRMGEADAARMLVDSVDVDRFTPNMVTVATQSALAAADPAALCPLVARGREQTDEQIWPLAEAMCAALEGDSARASQLIGQARRRSGLQPIDVTLAEKIVGAGANTRRAVSVQWDGVGELTAWRFGLAAAAGVMPPPALMASAGPRVRAWAARAPMLPLEERLRAAHEAASLGVFSHRSLAESYALMGDGIDAAELAESVPGRLRTAYLARRPEARMEALRAIWSDPADAADRNGRRILTAVAASRIPRSETFLADADELVAAMLSAGLDTEAGRWAGLVQASDASENTDRAWRLLAVGAPGFQADAARIGELPGEAADRHRTRLLVAALAGLGRVDPNSVAEDYALRLGAANAWTRALAAAAQRGERGSVALLAAVGMQTADWGGVPPENLFHILRALRAVGLDFEARMIAAEAMARL